jgi:hypothetical protein
MDVLDPSSSYTSKMKLEFAFNEFLSIDGTVTGATFTSVPEPASMGLLAIGGLALIKRRRR